MIEDNDGRMERERDRISQIRYARLNYPLWGGDRANGEIPETGDEAKGLRVGREKNKRGEWTIVWIRRERKLRVDSKPTR